VVDEGTSAVDPHTDELVQTVLRDAATKRGATVLAIAHRLQTILDFDRILVLGKTYIHTYIHTNIQTNTHSHTYIHTYKHTLTHIHTYIHTRILVLGKGEILEYDTPSSLTQNKNSIFSSMLGECEQ
jgi:ABC-type multidrug transport system fused ATPase/permease subunit